MTRVALVSLFALMVAGCSGSSSTAPSSDDPSGSESAGALTGSSGTVAFHGSLKLKDGTDDDFLPIYFTSLDISEDGTFKGSQAAQVDGGDGNLETGVRDIPSGKTKWVASSHRNEGTVSFIYTIDGARETDVYLYKVDGSKVSFMLKNAVTVSVGRKAATELLKKTFSEIVQKCGNGNVFEMNIH